MNATARTASLGGSYSNAVLEIIQGHHGENAAVVGILNDDEPLLIRTGVKETLGVATAFLEGDGNGDAVVQEVFQFFGREFAALAQAHFGMPCQIRVSHRWRDVPMFSASYSR